MDKVCKFFLRRLLAGTTYIHGGGIIHVCSLPTPEGTNSNNVRKNAFSLNLRRLGLERGTVHVNNEEFDDG